MKISWAFGDTVNLDPTVDIASIKNIGSTWGSWKTWRGCQTDNVICHDMQKADELLKKQFCKICNFYISKSIYDKLDRPSEVKLYEGKFSHEVISHEEIITLHLVSSLSDIVLLLGYNLEELAETNDKLLYHRARNQQNLIKQVIQNNAQVQWVIVNHSIPLAKNFQNLQNLTQDTLDNVLKFFLKD